MQVPTERDALEVGHKNGDLAGWALPLIWTPVG